MPKAVYKEKPLKKGVVGKLGLFRELAIPFLLLPFRVLRPHFSPREHK
jgi:hypothetical protein